MKHTYIVKIIDSSGRRGTLLLEAPASLRDEPLKAFLIGGTMFYGATYLSHQSEPENDKATV